MFIKNGTQLHNLDHVAVGRLGPVNARGVRPVTFHDGRGQEIGSARECDLPHPLPLGFVLVRSGDLLVNTAQIGRVEIRDGSARLYGPTGHWLGSTPADELQAALDAMQEEINR